MTKKLLTVLSDAVADGKIDDAEMAEIAQAARDTEKERDNLILLVQRLMVNLNSVSSKLAAKIVNKIDGVNISKTLNPQFYEVSISPQPLRLKLPVDDAKLWDIEVREQIAEALSEEIMRVLTSDDKRVHVNH